MAIQPVPGNPPPAGGGAPPAAGAPRPPGAAPGQPAATAAPAPEQDEFIEVPGLPPPQQALFKRLQGRIKEAVAFADLLPELEGDMLTFLKAKRLTVYHSARDGKEISTKFFSGTELHEIRLPISTASIAGFVALSQQPISIEDVYNAEELKKYHPNLKFDKSFDLRAGFRTKSMVVVPVKKGKAQLGVLQVINKQDGTSFNPQEIACVQAMSDVLANKFHDEFEGTNGPYEYLVKKGKLTNEQLQDFIKRSKREGTTMTYLLVTELKVPPEMIAASLEAYYQVPFLRYNPAIEPPKKLFDEKKLSLPYLRKQRWLPVAGDTEEVVVLIDDPSDMTRRMEIQRILNAKKYIFRVGFEEDILRYLGGGDVSSYLHALVGKMEEEGVDGDGAIEEPQEAGEVNENESAVISLVNRLIIDAQRAGASDIHVEPSKGRLPAKVRMRIDGSCRQALEIPSNFVKAVVARIKIMSRMDIAERRKPQDGKIVVRVKDRTIELRVATIPTVNGEAAVMRVLASGGALPFDKLNLSERNYRETKVCIGRPHGIFLVVGPTGSGKTTTLHAVLGVLNTPDKKIWTAEDPVEITQPGMCQVQMDHKIGFNFASALRAFLRADPDVILIGEMRDKETAHSGVEASLTGHMVFSTLHTNSAPETVIRLLDLGLDPMNFADALQGVLAQRLMRTLCQDCKQYYDPDEEEWERLVHLYGEEYFPELGVERTKTKLCKPGGCGKCARTGYKGRTGIHELLVATPRMKKVIAKSSPADEIRALAIEEGMRTLIQDGVAKVLRGQSDVQQLFKVATAH